MSIAHSSTERRTTATPGPIADVRRALTDVRHLLAFRVSGMSVRGRRTVRIALLVIAALSLAAAIVPAYLRDAGLGVDPQDILLLLPSAYLGVLVISLISGAASGGGRELLARDQGVAYPVSPTTDHLGALLLAPLNIAWILQSWVVLAMTAYALGPSNLWATQLPVVLWLVAATALAQALSWAIEWVRRGAQGTAIVRGLLVLAVAGSAALVASGNVTTVLETSPTVDLAILAAWGSTADWLRWVVGCLVVAAVAVGAIALGTLPAHRAQRRLPHDEMRLETTHYPARPMPASDLAALVRIDRATIWRSVPLRRGVTVLAVTPGLVALAGAIGWDMLPIMPGLVASGGALLFGINAWCLDGRGALWRDSLPVDPRAVFTVRSLVLLELLLGAVLVTIALGSLRAGAPHPAHVAALLTNAVVLPVQVVATSMTWSVRRPYAVDLRSARATPAPPMAMVGYSSRLAFFTTLTAMFIGGLAELGAWWVPVMFGIPFLLFSASKWMRAQSRWVDPVERCRVISTVAS